MKITLYILLFTSLLPLLILALLPFWSLIRSVFSKKSIDKRDDFHPPVSIIIACYNEEAYIERKINSFLAKENWIPGSEIIVVSGGSTDRTNDILLQYENREEVQLVILEHRTWKIDAVNLAVNQSKHAFLIFSDCRQEMKAGSVQELMQNLSDPEVGTVSASLCDSKNSKKASFFRAVLNFVAHKESESSSSLNVFGALYAQRKSVFREIPNDLLFDDLFVVVSTLKQKKRLVQEKNAVIYDVEFNEYYQKGRIRRLVRGLLIFLMNQSKLIFSLPKATMIRFLIYKYLKLLMPFFLMVLVFAVIALLSIEHVEMSNALIPSTIVVVFILLFRKQFQLFVRINVQILFAVLKYFFGGERSNEWEKLKTSVTK